MNTAIFLLAGLIWFYMVYRFYVRFIDRRVLQPDDRRRTPAHKLTDGIDFVPSPRAMLFGHHFSSIAGAGPIVGPILAYALFGWGPALLWILLGTAFIGIIHDYYSLLISVRSGGKSITEISGRVISPTAKWLFSIFVWLALVLIVAVFSVITAKTLAEKPEIVIPTLGLIVLAILFGLAVYRWRLKLLPVTVLAWIILILLVQMGNRIPIQATYEFWFYFFLLYSYIASSVPVWVLLQPRDYLSMTILFIGLVLGYAGMFVLSPSINGPIFTAFLSGNTPLVPMLFVIIACGAISGFHSLVASGTTAKQLNQETHGRFIGAGGMIFEGVLALLVLMMVAGTLFWKEAPAELAGFLFQDVMKEGPIITFGTAFGRAVSSLGIPQEIGLAFGILMLNAFVLTSLDTAVRLGRFVFQEALFQKNRVLSNRWVAGGVGILFAFVLASTNSWNIVWPIFGSANQLIAALALFTVTAYVVGIRKPGRFSFIPAVFMWVVTESSLLYLLIFQYSRRIFSDSGDTILACTAAVLAILGFVVAYEAMGAMKRSRDPQPQVDSQA